MRGLALAVLTFMFGYFRHINILEFILYSTVLCNYSHIHSKAFSLLTVFSRKGFYVNKMFFFVFVFHYYIIDFNKCLE